MSYRRWICTYDLLQTTIETDKYSTYQYTSMNRYVPIISGSVNN